MTGTEVSISPVPACNLSAEQIARWCELQKADPRLFSPFFRPEFTQAAAQVYENVEVAVFEQGGEVVGFFPYQRVRGRLAIPVGGMMSHFQGVVLKQGVTFSPTTLLESCDLVAWRFNHLLADQTEFVPYHTVTAGSPYLDLSQGYEAYEAERRKAGKKDFFKQIKRKTRQLEREIGPLRFECPVSDPQLLRTLLDWKSAQYRRNRTLNFIELPGTRRLLETIFRIDSTEFGGDLSALYAGERLLALEFGIRAGSTLHSWVTVYDAALPSKYSPGNSLLLKYAQRAEELGITRIDIGKGMEPYKRFWTSATTELAEGAVDTRPLPRLINAAWIRTRDWIRTSPLKEPARRCKQVVRPVYERLVYRSAKAVSVQQHGYLAPDHANTE